MSISPDSGNQQIRLNGKIKHKMPIGLITKYPTSTTQCLSAEKSPKKTVTLSAIQNIVYMQIL